MLFLFLFLLFFLPGGSLFGIEGNQLKYLAIISYSFMLVVTLPYAKQVKIKNDSLIIILLLLFLTIVSIFNNLLDMDSMNYSKFLDIGRNIGFIFIFIFGYIVSKLSDFEDIKRNLLSIAKIFIVIELIVCIDQIFMINSFSAFYSYEKVKSIESVLRAVGTFGNPNMLGWMTMQMLIVIFLFEYKKFRYVWLALSISLLLLTSSKSMILVTFFNLAFVYYLKNNLSIFDKRNVNIFIFLFLALIAFYFFLQSFGDVFKNMRVILDVIDNGLDSLTTIQGRYRIWEDAYEYFQFNSNWVNIIFGFGAIDEFRTLDNNYLMVFYKYGILGFFIHSVLYVYLLYIFVKIKSRNIYIYVLGVQYITMELILGVQSDNLGGWIHPIIMFLYAGLAIGVKSEEPVYQKKQATLE
jgi:hypothetical protein